MEERETDDHSFLTSCTSSITQDFASYHQNLFKNRHTSTEIVTDLSHPFPRSQNLLLSKLFNSHKPQLQRQLQRQLVNEMEESSYLQLRRPSNTRFPPCFFANCLRNLLQMNRFNSVLDSFSLMVHILLAHSDVIGGRCKRNAQVWKPQKKEFL